MHLGRSATDEPGICLAREVGRGFWHCLKRGFRMYWRKNTLMLDVTDQHSLGAQSAAMGESTPMQPGFPWKAAGITVGVMGLMLLVVYPVIPWYSENPLTCRIVSTKLIQETNTRVIRYELRNQAWFPVKVREYTGICNERRITFPFRHTPPAATLLSPGATVNGEFRMLHLLSVPEAYDTFAYVWEPTTQSMVERIADWIRELSGKGRPQVDAYLREVTRGRRGSHRLPDISMTNAKRLQGQAGQGMSSSP